MKLVQKPYPILHADMFIRIETRPKIFASGAAYDGFGAEVSLRVHSLLGSVLFSYDILSNIQNRIALKDEGHSSHLYLSALTQAGKVVR